MKRYMVFILNLFFLCSTFVGAQEFEITGKNVILYNLNDNAILYEQDADEKVSIASLTKMMTAIVAIENIDDLNKQVMITEKDFLGTDGYSKAGFKVGDKVTYLDLLYGILLPSGAEAVNAVINNTLKTEFISKMNEKAKVLEMDNTSFANGIGKDDEFNYSTARDLSKLLNYALKNDTFKKVFTTKEYVASNGLKLQSTLNHYKNILKIDEISGAKSGFTKKAGRCLASITTLNGVNYLLVVINSSLDKPYNAVLDTITMYEYYDQNYSYQTILDSNTEIKSVPIKWSKEKAYDIKFNEEVKKYLKNKESENLTYEYDGVEEIKYDTNKGTKLGVIRVYSSDKLLFESDVYLNEDLPFYNLKLWFGILILLLIVFTFVCVKKMKNEKKVTKKRNFII